LLSVFYSSSLISSRKNIPPLQLLFSARNGGGKSRGMPGSLYYAHSIEGRNAIGAIRTCVRARRLEIHSVYTKFRKSDQRGSGPTARVTVDTPRSAGSRLYRYTACNYDRI